MEETTLDFTKIKCKEHPLETMTNFCLNQKCLVGLCSNCVCLHTEAHVRQGSKPIYKPLKQIHKIMSEEMKQFVQTLQVDKLRIGSIVKSINERKSIFHKTIQQAKNCVLDSVIRIFTEIEQKFEEEVKLEEKNTGLHSVFEMELLLKKISREVNQIISDAQLLNTKKFVQMVKAIKINTSAQVRRIHDQATNQIRLNEEFSPRIQFKKQLMGEVQVMIRRLFTLSWKYPVAYSKPQQKFYEKQNQMVNYSKTSDSIWAPNINNSFYGKRDLLQNISSTRSSVLSSIVNIHNEKGQRPSSNFGKSNSINASTYIPQIILQTPYFSVENKTQQCQQQRGNTSRVVLQTFNMHRR